MICVEYGPDSYVLIYGLYENEMDLHGLHEFCMDFHVLDKITLGYDSDFGGFASLACQVFVCCIIFSEELDSN